MAQSSACPPAFKGPVYKATPIPGDLRMPLRSSALSVFNGSTTHFPLMEEYDIIMLVTIRDCNHALSLCPSFIELNLPTGLLPMCSRKVDTSCPLRLMTQRLFPAPSFGSFLPQTPAHCVRATAWRAGLVSSGRTRTALLTCRGWF